MSVFLETLQQYSYFGNTVLAYSLGLAYLLVTLIVLKLFQSFILHKVEAVAKKTDNVFDDAVIDALKHLGASFYLSIALFVGLTQIYLSQLAHNIIHVALLSIVLYRIIQTVSHIINFLIEVYVKKLATKGEQGHARAMFSILKLVIVVSLWILAGLFILSNIGVNVTSFVASLGIGGLAIALALQNVLSDLFSSFSIFMDKPFQIGDYITIGEHSGTVMHIGLKSTRLKTLRGEELIIPNKELTATRVQNFQALEQRREVLLFSLVYETKQSTLEHIPVIIQKIVEKMDGVNFGRCHMSALKDSGVEFELIYHVESSDYVVYMDVKQQLLIEIMRSLQKEKADFAYPTQVVYVKK
ncbi:mechanosensitive ion channel family protein [Patescibacteria group bacterium]|nr:mechanosensitive ion channel family protein [Patescibacteria group bacterium]MBU1721928.1 mechanosensitive ion channel family protein [Patescibacteria group bacterium]MBU1901545.1 mechanosensitive ion channel family protein [Patescibacteria group bacterium]